MFATALAVISLWPLRFGGHVRVPVLAVATAFLAVAILRPAILHPLNSLWMMLGLLLGRIVSPVIVAVLFILVFTPAGLISRVLGRDPLRLRPDPGADSYWISRHPPGPGPETMSKQF
jgi:hypothetical protein